MLAWAFNKFGIWDRIFLRIFEFSKIFWAVISKSTSKKLFLKIDLPETLWKLCLSTKFPGADPEISKRVVLYVDDLGFR